MDSIEITLNGDRHEIPQGSSLEKLLELFSLSSKRVAIELNGSVIRRAEWPATALRPQDKIEVVHFVGGG